MTVAVNSILDSVEARLKLIDKGNGYNTTARNVKRAGLKAFKPYDLPAMNFWSTGVGSKRNAFGSDERSIHLFVEYHTKTNDEPFITVASKLAADIVTAINRAATAPKVSDDQSLDLDGTVSDVVFDGYDYEIGEGQAPWCGVLVRFTIKYNAEINDMTDFSA